MATDEQVNINEVDDRDLGWALRRWSAIGGVTINDLQLRSEIDALDTNASEFDRLGEIADGLSLGEATAMPAPDVARLPMLVFLEEGRWGVVSNVAPNEQWIVEIANGAVYRTTQELSGKTVYFDATHTTNTVRIESFRGLLRDSIRQHKTELLEAVVASTLAGILAVIVSLFSMQVYDRVIPSRNSYTLAMLVGGVFLMLLFDLAMRFARARIMDQVITKLDARLSREVFQKLVNIRVDQFPNSVGSLASQLRGYEQVRGFYTATTLFALADFPIAVLMLLLLMVIGSPWVALVPFTAAIIGLILGLNTRRRVDHLAMIGAKESNMKTGVLVETVEGIETIKAGGGGWKFLSRWIDLNHRTIANDLATRNVQEHLGYYTNMLQQFSYVGIVAVGALVVIKGDMTMGALIACSILGGRILAPVMAIPGIMVQRAHSDAAMKGLEFLYTLQSDNHGIAKPLAPEKLHGNYELSNVLYQYQEDSNAVDIAGLRIREGERVAILGAIGSGKSTLLRLLSGLYRPQKGKVLLDGLDLSHINPLVVSRSIGYLQQDHRLFQGTLRENLLIGLPDPGDDVLRDALMKSGLIQLVARHPLGLELPISEGGKGLSGGQKQLVAFTRIILTQPSVLLLDEPTASMDEAQERHSLSSLIRSLRATDTLVVVTHRPSLLPLVNRIIVMAHGKVFMDGPRDEVIKALQQQAQSQAQAQQQAQAQPQAQTPPQQPAPAQATAAPSAPRVTVTTSFEPSNPANPEATP